MEDKMIRYTLRVDRLSFRKFRYIMDLEYRSTNKVLEQYIKRRVAEFEAVNGIISEQDLPPKAR